MKSSTACSLFSAWMFSCMVPPAMAADAAAKPNIIVILVDDMGFSDIGCYGGEIPTPHLDSLAKGGLRFTQFYNTARCCPTRASLLTGVYSHQAGIGHMVDDRGEHGYRGRLHENTATIAECLKPAGYFTAMSGKWHVGQHAGVTPKGRGFDRNLSSATGGFYFPETKRAALNLNGDDIANDDKRLPRDWYSTDLFTDFGIKFIDEAIADKKPFFLYLAHMAPHFPLQASAEEIAKFRGKYLAGWDSLRFARHQRQIALGVVEQKWTPSPRPEKVMAWETYSAQEQERFDHIMAVYAATVSLMDQSIGKLVSGLKERGILENTLILFMSDNGGNAESGVSGSNQGDPTTAKSDWFCGESWAFLQNTPFARYKHYNHEGGIASPLIAHWPNGINVNSIGNRTGSFTRKLPGGPLCHTPAHVIDIMPTCLQSAGAAHQTSQENQALLPMEGQSLMKLFKGGDLASRSLFWEHEGNAAIREGDHKLVRVNRKGDWELYDLSMDRTEQQNLAKKNPAKVKELAAAWEAWAERAHVKPYPRQAKRK